MRLAGLPPLPTIRRLADGKLYVMPERHAHLGGRTGEQQATQALAGPFTDRWAAGQWIVEHLESQLTPAQLPIWGDALERAGGVDAEYGHLIYVLATILANKPQEYVERCAGPARHQVDRKLLAAGDAA